MKQNLWRNPDFNFQISFAELEMVVMMMAITHEEEQEKMIGQQFVLIGSIRSGPLRHGSRSDESVRTGFDNSLLDMKAGLSPLPKPFLMLSLQALVLMGMRTCLLCMLSTTLIGSALFNCCSYLMLSLIY